MKKAKIIIGYLLILIGIGLPLSSMISLSLSQYSGERQYIEYANKDHSEDGINETKIKEYNKEVSKEDTQVVDPFRNRDYKRFYNISSDEDATFAFISIPKLNLFLPIRLGAGDEHLAMGAAHVDGTHLPVGGLNTRSVIAGHRSTSRSLFFYNIHELEPGDEIEILRGNERLIYKVSDNKIISYTAWEELKPIKGEDTLTLLSCMPYGSEPEKRFIVNAKRKSEVVENNSELKENRLEEEIRTKDKVKPIKSEIMPSLKTQRDLIYGVTIGGIILFLFVLMKFITRLIKS